VTNTYYRNLPPVILHDIWCNLVQRAGYHRPAQPAKAGLKTESNYPSLVVCVCHAI